MLENCPNTPEAAGELNKDYPHKKEKNKIVTKKLKSIRISLDKLWILEEKW